MRLSPSQMEALRVAHLDPPRHYHTFSHAAQVAQRVRMLAEREGLDDPTVPWLAAWFHDAIYVALRSDNEARSAALALEWGPGWLDADWERVAALIRLTAAHGSVTDVALDAQVLLDADLSVLGAAPHRYDAYAAGVRAEYGVVPDALFNPGRAALLRGWLATPRLFLTDTAHALWDAAARENLRRELRGRSSAGPG